MLPSVRFPVGLTAQHTARITGSLIDDFARLSGDHSRVHMDAEFARANGFRGRVAHGALLGALVSGVIGTELPGDAGLLHELHLTFRRPCCEGDDIEIRATVAEVHDVLQLISCDVVIALADGQVLSRGHYRSGLLGAAS
jgi:hypothetical protein